MFVLRTWKSPTEHSKMLKPTRKFDLSSWLHSFNKKQRKSSKYYFKDIFHDLESNSILSISHFRKLPAVSNHTVCAIFRPNLKNTRSLNRVLVFWNSTERGLRNILINIAIMGGQHDWIRWVGRSGKLLLVFLQLVNRIIASRIMRFVQLLRWKQRRVDGWNILSHP